MRNPIYFLQRNVGLFPLASAVVGGAIGFGVGATGRIAVDSIGFLYDNAVYVARNFPNLQIDFGQIVSSIMKTAEETIYRAAFDGTETGAVYSAGSLILAKKVSNIFRSKKGGD